ncbi:hypothetical protein ElyMa_006647000 [Elysia marginata]|uniref:Uncharacterized protein n=1 Tax=Elysia marginata TaxID=1093978 RepID=A0AAV4IMD9_9GAST|nr:hypothetical protein ElyMa_006647000 [Elysia marginata]
MLVIAQQHRDLLSYDQTRVKGAWGINRAIAMSPDAIEMTPGDRVAPEWAPYEPSLKYPLLDMDEANCVQAKGL